MYWNSPADPEMATKKKEKKCGGKWFQAEQSAVKT